jgi:dTDP-glucose 4,6-dehydratase
MKTILVLASNSFTGAHFVHLALQKGYRVIGISRSDEYAPIMLPYRYKFEPDNFEFHQLDLNHDLKEIVGLCDRHEPFLIANFSAQGEVRNSWKYPDQWYQTNCMSVVNFTNAIKERDYIHSYVASSTPEVYGSTAKNMVESDSYSPSTPYAASKLAGDLHTLTLFKRYGFPARFTRSANVYGIHQQLYRIIPRTIIYLKLGKTIELHGGGKSLRSFVHIRDVADATWQVATNGKPGEAYHVSTVGEEISIGSLVALICEMMGDVFESSVSKIEENFGQDEMYSLGIDRIKNELGWEPQISLRQGIEEMIKWITDDWDVIQKMPLDYIHKP